VSTGHLTESVVTVVLDAFRPITAAVTNEAALRELVEALGWRMPEGFSSGVTGLEALASAVNSLQAALDAWSSGDRDEAALLNLLEQAAMLFDLLAGLPVPGNAPAPMSRLEFWSTLLSDLPAYLLATWLRREAPLMNAVLELTGILDREPVAPDDDRFQGFRRTVIRWDRLGTLLTDPRDLMAQVYGWGGTLDADRLLRSLERVLAGCGLLAMRAHPGLALVEQHYGPGIAPPEGVSVLKVPLFVAESEAASGLQVEAGLEVFPVPEAPGTPGPRGLLVGPYGTAALTTPFPFNEDTALTFLGTGEVGGMGVVLLPGEARFVPGGPASVSGVVGVELRHAPASPRTLLGDPAGTGLSVAALTLSLEAHLVGLEVEEVVGRLGADGLRLTVDFSEADGFLATVTGGLKGAVEADILVEWSSVHGLRFSGAGGLEFIVPVDVELGPLHVSTLTLRGGVAEGGGIRLDAGVTASLQLGPVQAAVDTVGLRLSLRPSEAGPLFGLAPSFGFLPPRGAALSIDGGPVTGGGFLFFDPDKEQYAGGLYLRLETLTLNAIGLLTTHLPDGSRGYSLLVIIQASGFSPIQLGYGFTLNGLGGLLGIQRTVAVDVLREGVRNRTLDAILFSPDDPTPRAPQILSTLQSVFPPAANQYVFGPMVLLGWGVPVTLITMELALLLELPSPLRLIVLGRVRSALPDPEHPIVSLNLDVVGIIDFDRQELSIDGSLYDSRVGPFALSGDMAARASWGENPGFAMALGGFHPAFTPPPGFPSLRRLALALSTGDNPRLRMEAYLALTSNTLQVGARLELYVEAAGFSLEGGLGFDTLIQLSPFRLLAQIHAHLALKRGRTTLMGLDVLVNLTGPAPWVLWGEARFKILFVKFKVSFRATFGRAEAVPAVERQEVWPVLRESLAAEGNWSAQLPSGDPLVVLRSVAGEGEVLAHPLGTLTISQNLVPLERTLELFGSVPPKDYDRFTISGAAGLQVVGTQTQYFAPAQFRRMSDAEKLASPSFERMVSGVRVAPQVPIAFGHVQETPLDYEQSIIRDSGQPDVVWLDEPYTPAGATVAALAEHGPAGVAEVRERGRLKFAPAQPGPAVADPQYVVVTRDGLTPVALDGLDGSYTAAAERLRRHPGREELQIVRAEEVQPT
jgi:hypothetical protein